MNLFCQISFDNLKDAFAGFLNSITNSFANFTILDAIDIVIIAAILFVAFNFLKSRKAGALLIGIAVVVILSVISELFALNATQKLFSIFIKDIGIITLIIIFQPEIRDALEKIGSGSVNSIMTLGDQKHRKQVYYRAIDQICTAVADLSRTKTGALIVISRTTKLDDVTETGVVINADVNSHLLRNLFFNKAPLHDGAVVIEDGKILAAGCLLPLTRRTDLNGDLGTRHRAAIGMSETSDAIVIIVSEETGIVSIAYDCELTRDYTSESLRRYLMTKIVRDTKSEFEN